MATSNLDEVSEKETSYFRCPLENYLGVAITRSQITALTLTLYEEETETVINSRTAYDLYHAGAWDRGATVDSSGNLTVRFDANDNAIVNLDSRAPSEVHVAVFEGTLSGGDAFKKVFRYLVNNLIKTT